jgi:hypothetical protein
MTDQVPNLSTVAKGGVDLADPVQKVVRDFATQMALHKGVAVVIVGLTEDGTIPVVAHIPGGLLQGLGMLTSGAQQLGFSNLQKAMRAGVDAPPS